MARGVETGLGGWLVFGLLLVSSSVVVVLEWNQKCDGWLRNWLLTAVVVTAVCGLLGGLFHGRGDSTQPSRFLDDDDCDDDYVGGSAIESQQNPGAMDLTPMDGAPLPASSETPHTVIEEGNGSERAKAGRANGSMRDSMDEGSVTSGHGSSISVQLASRASSSLQYQYFGPGPKVFPDAIFLILVLSQWFLAGWSVVGAALYFRLFQGNRTCSPLLRHWTLLVVIIGFLSCLLAVCYSGIMYCMLGSPFTFRRGRKNSERDRFHVDISSSSHSVTSTGPGLM